MSDQPNTKEVSLNSAEVPQHHRMAAGKPVDGKTLPACKTESKPQA